jgi:hypothetical protein
MTRSEALARLRASRDADHDAPIWADNGRSVRMLAEAAGVRVVYAHVELGKEMTTEYRTVEGRAHESVL